METRSFLAEIGQEEPTPFTILYFVIFRFWYQRNPQKCSRGWIWTKSCAYFIYALLILHLSCIIWITFFNLFLYFCSIPLIVIWNPTYTKEGYTKKIFWKPVNDGLLCIVEVDEWDDHNDYISLNKFVKYENHSFDNIYD